MRRLTVQVEDPVAMQVAAVLDRRLSPDGEAPLAVALSGGSDSLALFHLVSAWARMNGRRVIALTVDHGLQPDSAAWAQRCAAMAADRGRPHRTLRWEGKKPTTGIPAAARAARHALLAQAAREAGARVLLMGHTASDLAESAAMRAAGSTLPDAREWGPSPAWPEGRGVFLLRPLLGLRRGELQDWLAGRGVTWIDDPANLDLRFARARARHTLSVNRPAAVAGRLLPSPWRGEGSGMGVAPVGSGTPPGEAPRSAVTRSFAGRVRTSTQTALAATASTPIPGPSPLQGEGGTWGYILLPREASANELAAACLCAAGATRPPRTDQLTALLARDTPFTATLAGARIEATADHLAIFRETGELSRRPLPPHALCQDEPIVFDGRFEVTAAAPGLVVQPLWGHAPMLPKAEQTALKVLPAAARGALPLVTDGAGLWTCPILAVSPLVHARSLVQARFEAALGLVAREADAHPVADHGEPAGGVLSCYVTTPLWPQHLLG